MVAKILNVLRRSRYLGMAVLFAFTVVTAGGASLLSNPHASAQACDKVNIVYCGLSGSGANGYIRSFQTLYASGQDHGHADLKTAFRWAGATDTSVANMSTNNTKMGTLYRNGDIKVNGTVVGQSSWVAARFTEGTGFTKISDGVWARKTTTSFAEASAPVLVHYGSNGAADFAVMVNCGNSVKFTPKTPPQPAPSPTPQPQPQPTPQPSSTLECNSLGKSMEDDSLQVDFEATASTTNTTIAKYVFDFGDGSQPQTVTTDSDTADITYTYSTGGVERMVRVTVFDTSGHSSTNSDCTLQLQIPTPQTPTPVAECKPGVPVGNEACNSQPVVLSASTTTTPTPPTDLPHSGSNTAAFASLFGATTLGSTFLYKFVTRRKLG